jgi:hypothetical protein
MGRSQREKKKVYANKNSEMRRTAPVDDGEYRWSSVFFLFFTMQSQEATKKREREREKKRQKVWRKMQTNTKPQNDDGDDDGREGEEKYNIYTMKNLR